MLPVVVGSGVDRQTSPGFQLGWFCGRVKWQVQGCLDHGMQADVAGRTGDPGPVFLRICAMLRWEWLARSEPGRGWARLPCRSERQVAAMSAVSMSVALGDGTSAKLWTDAWAPVGPLCFFAPDLFTAISRTGKRRTVKDGLYQHHWAREIVGALTTQVLCQYLRVWRLLNNLELDPLASGRFIWKWSPDGKYSASSAYRAFFVGAASLPGAKELWRAKAPLCVKFFF